MLSNVSIQKFITSGDIKINPWSPEMLDAARITLYLGEKVLIPDKSTIVDIKNKTLPTYQEIKLSDDNPFPLMPNMFVLSETLEEIGISERIGMLIEGRSTLARLGISVVQTAMIIDTGQKPKKMTLEIHNSGSNTVLLYPKMKFCRACFFLVDPPATIRHDDTGKYQAGDKNIPIFNEEFKEEIINAKQNHPQTSQQNSFALDTHSYDIQIWTDGACVFNGTPKAKAAWAFVAGEIEKAGLVPGPKQTNNVAEGLAILHALNWAAEQGYKTIQLHTDSQISLFNLKKPARLVKENREIFQQIEQTIKENHLNVQYEKVLGHSDNINNNRADKLANTLAAS